MPTERVPFRFIVMECCGHHLCWVNPRLPNFCPECGKRVYPEVKSWVTLSDENATLKIKELISHPRTVPPREQSQGRRELGE